MDLSPTRFDRDRPVTRLPTDLAVLLAGVGARQAASSTARAQAALHPAVAAEQLFAPVDGAFNGGMARVLVRWGRPDEPGAERP